MRFFVASALERSLVGFGGSITYGTGATTPATLGWYGLTTSYIQTSKTGVVLLNKSVNSGMGGTGSWWGLTRLAADVIAYAPDTVTLDWVVNDASDPIHNLTQEAAIRRLYAALPNVKLIALLFGSSADNSQDVTTNVYSAQRDEMIAICNHYGIPYIDVYARFKELVDAGTYHQSELYNGGVHPSDLGHSITSQLVREAITSLLVSGQQLAAVPERLAACADYEETPTIRNGIDNDGETGTGWATVNTTTRQSSTANDTISWTGTFASWGLDANYGAGAGSLQYQMDGGDWTDCNLVTKEPRFEFWSGSRAAHTVVLKVVSGLVSIKRFLTV